MPVRKTRTHHKLSVKTIGSVAAISAPAAIAYLKYFQPKIPTDMWQALFHAFLVNLQHLRNHAGRTFASGVFVIDITDDILRGFVDNLLQQCTPRAIARTHKKFQRAPFIPVTAQLEFLINPPVLEGTDLKRVALVYKFQVNTTSRGIRQLLFLKLEGAQALSTRHAVSAVSYYGGRSLRASSASLAQTPPQLLLKEQTRREDSKENGHKLGYDNATAFRAHPADFEWYESGFRQGREMFIPASQADTLIPFGWHSGTANMYASIGSYRS